MTGCRSKCRWIVTLNKLGPMLYTYTHTYIHTYMQYYSILLLPSRACCDTVQGHLRAFTSGRQIGLVGSWFGWCNSTQANMGRTASLRVQPRSFFTRTSMSQWHLTAVASLQRWYGPVPASLALSSLVVSQTRSIAVIRWSGRSGRDDE